jgi:hypothetical protein
MSDAFKRPPWTLTVQYNVEALDGTTPSESFSTYRSSEDYLRPNDENIFVVDQDAVGLIDPDLDSGGSRGDRFVPWMMIAAQGGVPEVLVVDGEDPSRVLCPVELAEVVPGTWYRKCTFRVPQGGAILVRGTDPGATVVRLRITKECDECCCCDGGGGGGTPPTGVPVSVRGSDNELGADTTNFVRRDHGHRLEVQVQDEQDQLVGARPTLKLEGNVALVDDPVNDRLVISVGTSPVQTLEFEDDETVDIPVGPQTAGLIAVDLNINLNDGRSSAHRLTFAPSPSGVGFDCLAIPSNQPASTVEVSADVAGGQVIMRLTGTGTGTPSAASYRITDTIARALA